MSKEQPNYNFDPSTADAVPQDLDSLTPSEARMPGTNPPKIERTSVTDKILGYNPGKKKPHRSVSDY